MFTYSTALIPYWRDAVALAANFMAGPPAVVAALLPPPPPLRPTSSMALTPYGRGAVAMSADVIAGPPAVVAAAAREVDLVDGPRPPLGDAACGLRPTLSQALLPSSPPPPYIREREDRKSVAFTYVREHT